MDYWTGKKSASKTGKEPSLSIPSEKISVGKKMANASGVSLLESLPHIVVAPPARSSILIFYLYVNTNQEMYTNISRSSTLGKYIQCPKPES